MPIISPDHYTVRSKDIDASWKFYEQVLGLQVRKRDVPVPAFIVSIWPDRQVVHVFQASDEMEAIFAKYPPSEALNGWNTGRIHHVEFWATGLADFKQRWNAQGVKFTERMLPDKYQVGLQDPDGITVNLNFPPSEAAA
jgi:catechol 2,3-dioxygenase-like lactoylglutathione lyase family enzyme